MPLKYDLLGKTFGRLTVTARDNTASSKQPHWLCQCSCGKQTSVRAAHLRDGRVNSCGCLRAEMTGDRQRTHGQTLTPLYRVWRAMLDRCYLDTCESFDRYGGRGITVCDAWRESFENFSRDMADGYDPALELDRRENNGNYCKDNCRWATRTEQCRNRNNNRRFEFEGQTRCLVEITEMTNTKYSMVLRRLGRGWSLRDALYQPPGTWLRPQQA